jgi:hypothetical protein
MLAFTYVDITIDGTPAAVVVVIAVDVLTAAVVAVDVTIVVAAAVDVPIAVVVAVDVPTAVVGATLVINILEYHQKMTI